MDRNAAADRIGRWAVPVAAGAGRQLRRAGEAALRQTIRVAVTGLARSPIFPELPTIAETALPGFEAVLHYGIVAPAGTPKPIVTKLNAALRQAVMSAELKQKLAADGTEPLPSTPEEYVTDIDKEETKWSAIVKKSGAKAE